MSSARVLNVTKELLGAEKAGFLGTLDVQAIGVLPIALGSATKLISFVPASDKEYIGELVLGMSTVTDDTEGAVIERKGAVGLEASAVNEALQAVASQKTQVPPHVSAKRLEGVRGYKALRKEGRLLDFAATPAAVRSLGILRDWQDGDLRHIVFRMTVTPGYYVRGFCRDVGMALGCGGCMGRLLRTKAHGFGIGDTLSLDQLKRKAALADWSFVKTGMDSKDLLGALTHVRLNEEQWSAFVHGRSVETGLMDGAVVTVLRPDGRLGGIGGAADGRIYPRKVFAA
ncbi:MAG: tRNA pseudouridine(55) synthase TruB [Candidatus Cryosericum sp.]